MIADDNMDGNKLAVSASGRALTFDPNDGTIMEDLGKSFSEYIESIRDNLLLGKLHYGGSECGLIESAWESQITNQYLKFKV